MVDTNLSSKVEMYISARKLPSKDLLSKSDPQVVVWQKLGDEKWAQIGQTEAIMNNENPDFKTRFIVDFFFEQQQKIKFEVWDVDGSNSRDFCGQCEITMAALANAPGNECKAQLFQRNGHKFRQAHVLVRVEELVTNNMFMKITPSGEKLDKMDFFGKSDPFLEFYKVNPDGKQTMVHKTEVVRKTITPRWREFTISLTNLCNANEERPILVKCYDWDGDNSDPDFIGEFTCTACDLKDSKQAFHLNRPAEVKKALKKRKTPKSHGQIRFHVEEFSVPSFLEFMKGGMNVGLMVAIDYTASNQHPNQPQSLHYLHGGPNSYEKAITSIGNIVAPYDSDQNFPVWGFGGKVGSPQQPVSHCFPLNMNPNNPEVHGVPGILGAYRNSFNIPVLLSAPTKFAPIIQVASQIASAPFSSTYQHYNILLIITDGVINDMRETTDRIVAASSLPLSIIIVGVGNADFSQMHNLDGDDVKLRSSTGQMAKRDLVQFVAMKDYNASDLERLAKDTLAEVPGQLLQFAREMKIMPLPPRVVDPNAVIIGAQTPAPQGQGQFQGQQQPQVQQPPGQFQQVPPQQGGPPPQGFFGHGGPPPQQGHFQQGGPPPQQQQFGHGGPPQQGFFGHGGPPPQQQFQQGPPPQQGGFFGHGGPPQQGHFQQGGPPQQGHFQQGGPPQQGHFQQGGPPQQGHFQQGGPPQQGHFQQGGPPQQGHFQQGGPPQQGFFGHGGPPPQQQFQQGPPPQQGGPPPQGHFQHGGPPPQQGGPPPQGHFQQGPPFQQGGPPPQQVQQQFQQMQI